MSEIETANVKRAKRTQRKSMQTNGNGTHETNLPMLQRSMPAAFRHIPIVVSGDQFKAVETAHTNSVNLLDNCASVLLSAMESAVPPKDSGRVIGEYTGQNMRQMAKSVRDLIETKTNVVRSMYQISRDEI